MATAPYPTLFSTFRLGHVEARNRIVSTSHGINLAEGGAPSDRLIAYHAAKAEGGCVTVMMFGSGAASAMSPIPNNHVNILMDSAVPGPTVAAAAVKAHGALAISQVTALGRRTSLLAELATRWPQGTVDAPTLHLIGDAFPPKHLRHAMVDGASTGRAI